MLGYPYFQYALYRLFVDNKVTKWLISFRQTINAVVVAYFPFVYGRCHSGFWVVNVFLFSRKTVNNSSEMCLKNGNDRLRKGNLRRHVMRVEMNF